MATRRINGDEVAHGEVTEVTYDRPYRWFYNPYGDKAWLPADPVQMSLWMEGGWTLHKPRNPLKKPTSQKMRDGSVFEFSNSAADVSDAERVRLNRNPSQLSAAPTATYYTAEGTALNNLPADAASMADYLKAGLTLDPPVKTPGEVKQLHVV